MAVENVPCLNLLGVNTLRCRQLISIGNAVLGNVKGHRVCRVTGTAKGEVYRPGLGEGKGDHRVGSGGGDGSHSVFPLSREDVRADGICAVPVEVAVVSSFVGRLLQHSLIHRQVRDAEISLLVKGLAGKTRGTGELIGRIQLGIQSFGGKSGVGNGCAGSAIHSGSIVIGFAMAVENVPCLNLLGVNTLRCRQLISIGNAVLGNVKGHRVCRVTGTAKGEVYRPGLGEGKGDHRVGSGGGDGSHSVFPLSREDVRADGICAVPVEVAVVSSFVGRLLQHSLIHRQVRDAEISLLVKGLTGKACGAGELIGRSHHGIEHLGGASRATPKSQAGKEHREGTKDCQKGFWGSFHIVSSFLFQTTFLLLFGTDSVGDLGIGHLG